MFETYNSAKVEFALGARVSNEGRNSEVFLIQDKHLSATLVAKRITREEFRNLETYFFESRVLYLSRHPNVVPVHYACYDDNHVFIVMPYYRNGSMKRLIDCRFLTVREIITYATQFLSGLNNIHANGHVHFDIKPDNILISDRGEAVVSDFGLARPTDHRGHAEAPGLYNLHVPPEELTGLPLTRRSDIYGVGLTLYRMCNGNNWIYEQFARFIDSDDELNEEAFYTAIINEQFPDRSKYLPHIPRKLRNTVNKCLSADPLLRYNSIFEVINDIASITGEDLDWQYSVVDNKQQWIKEVDGVQYYLLVDTDGTAIARKRTANTDQRISAYCTPTISVSEIKRFLGAY